MSLRFSLPLALLLLTVGVSPAQGRHVFLVRQTSSFTYGGSVNLPLFSNQPIVGVPNNSFNAMGTTHADLMTSGNNVVGGQFVPGGLVTVPTLNAIVANPIPFFPNLASVSITGVTLDFTSTAFPVNGGSFSTMVTTTTLSGQAVVTALGMTTTTPLAGLPSTPQPATGTIVSTPDGYALVANFNQTLPFSDPTTGVTATLNLNGTVIADYRPLNTDRPTISVSTGGVQSLYVSTGGNFGGDMYGIFASATGTSPGIPLPGGFTLPLISDLTFIASINGANLPPLGNTFGNLNPLGGALATITVPGGLPPSVSGQTYYFAYATASPGGNVGMVSNPVSLILTP